MDTVLILKTEISQTSVSDVVELLKNKKSKTVAICNANTLVRSYKNIEIQNKINNFDIKAPDGFPVAMSSKILYKNQQKRVDGFNVFHETIKNGLENNLTHYFFGNNERVVSIMIKNLKQIYPDISISGFYCPPNLPYDELCKEEYVMDLMQKKPDIVWVSLGFPKQEEFISEIMKKYKIDSNFVGVGAVFEWIAGTKIKAPEWLANLGMEWVLRLLQEPKRLFRRYLIDNFLFILYFIKQYVSK